MRVQRSSFKLLNDKGEENEELKYLLERPWYEELIRLVLMSRFQGATLIEMFDVDKETLELDNVTEIPQSNFIAQKGVIVKEEYDDNGADYREGIYRDYYLQVGGGWDLGMLNQLAMIVLAKKLGLGSWMSYVDKYGIPPIFAVTDRMDTGRRDELFEMLSNFRQNMFAVLQGNEKIEVPRISESNPHQVFLSLIDDVCNKEISKRVLGGTATTDEKSFVGSAEVQERVAQDRYEADKLLFKYVFNTKIRPRLTKISPLYKGFDKFYLEWDNQETLDINGYIDAVSKLSASFEFDTEEIRQRTGLPIVGVRSLSAAEPQPAPEPDGSGDTSKKKDKTIGADLRVRPDGSPTAQTEPPTAATWDAAVEQLVEQVRNGTANAADLNRDLVLKYYSGLNKAAQNGWGDGYYTSELARSFRENLLKFSGAKSYTLISKMIAEKANFKDKNAFLEQAKKLVSLHNGTYQNVEEKFAANSASSARAFQTYQKDADLYPNLKFRTMGDSDVRPEHAANEGVIKPVNDWTKIPPLDYGCRCWLEQTMEKPNGKDITVYDDKIANNAALNGEIFVEKNSYFQGVTKANKQAVYGNAELMKKYMPYNNTKKVGDKTVFISDFADMKDLTDNVKAAELLAEELQKDVYVRYHINPGYGLKERNPELGIETQNKLYDLKTYRPVVDGKNVPVENFVKNSIRTLQKQRASGVLDFSGYKGGGGDLKKAIAEGLEDNIYNKNYVQNIIVIFRSKAYKISRSEVAKGDFSKLL